MVGRIQLIGTEGPQPLSNLTIVRAVGCLDDEANDTWALVKATNPRPVRARVVERDHAGGTTSHQRHNRSALRGFLF